MTRLLAPLSTLSMDGIGRTGFSTFATTDKRHRNLSPSGCPVEACDALLPLVRNPNSVPVPYSRPGPLLAAGPSSTR